MWSADAGAGVKSCMNLAHGGRWEGQVEEHELEAKTCLWSAKGMHLDISSLYNFGAHRILHFAKTSVLAKPTVVNFHHTLLQQASEGPAWKCHTVLQASRPQNEITSTNCSCSPWRCTIEQY